MGLEWEVEMGGVRAMPPLAHRWASLAPDSSDLATQASMSSSSRLRE